MTNIERIPAITGLTFSTRNACRHRWWRYNYPTRKTASNKCMQPDIGVSDRKWLDSHRRALWRSEPKERLSSESVSDTRCKDPEKKTNWPVQGSERRSVGFRKLWEDDLEQLGLGKGKNLSTELGFYSESHEKLLEDFTQEGREQKQKQEDQFWIVLVRENCLNNALTLNLELTDGTHRVCLFIYMCFDSKTDRHFMYSHFGNP